MYCCFVVILMLCLNGGEKKKKAREMSFDRVSDRIKMSM